VEEPICYNSLGSGDVQMSKIRNSSFLKLSNLRVVIREILKHQPVSKAALAKKLQVGHSTVVQLLKPLIDRRIIVETALGISTGGRPPILLRINPEAAYGLVVDLSGHNVKIALMNCALQAVDTVSIELTDDIYVDLESIVQHSKVLMERVNGNRIIGVCVAISGVMNPVTGKISSSLIKGLEAVRLGDYLTTRLELPIFVENDANLSALGEFMKMDKETNNMFYIHMGEGLGGGFIIDRGIFRGDRGYAGEIGKIVYSVEPFRTVGDVYADMLRNQNPTEDEIVKLLFTIVLNVACTLDMVHFVVGGKKINITDRMLSDVESLVKEEFYGFDVEIRKSTDEPDSILTGSMEYLIENSLAHFHV